MVYWKYRAIDRLKGYRGKKVSIQNLKDQLARLESKETSIRNAADPESGVKENALLSILVEKDEYAEMLFRAEKFVEVVERGLSVLSEEERHWLDMMYIQPTKDSKEKLMEELGLQETSSLYKRINKPLHEFTVAIYGGISL